MPGCLNSSAIRQCMQSRCNGVPNFSKDKDQKANPVNCNWSEAISTAASFCALRCFSHAGASLCKLCTMFMSDMAGPLSRHLWSQGKYALVLKSAAWQSSASKLAEHLKLGVWSAICTPSDRPFAFVSMDLLIQQILLTPGCATHQQLQANMQTPCRY